MADTSDAQGWSWRTVLSKRRRVDRDASSEDGVDDETKSRWIMGMLNAKHTIEVPGSVLLLAQGRNEPLGLRDTPARTSQSSLPTGIPEPKPSPEKKLTKDGQVILEPQPDDSHNDPLNWDTWRRDSALVSLGLHCMIGGGMTTILAAGFTNVATDYDIEVSQVSLTVGLYMLGLGFGSVLFSPTAILWGKRPVYLFGAVLFILSSVWCALSPNFISLILGRIVQGIAVSPVECLPSATIAEIFFLHERAYRIGVYTLLLLGGKNLVPLASGVVIQNLGWRWVFWVVAMVVGFSGTVLYFLVPETFWDRSPIPKKRHHTGRPSFFSRKSSSRVVPQQGFLPDSQTMPGNVDLPADGVEPNINGDAQSPEIDRQKKGHVGFGPDAQQERAAEETGDDFIAAADQSRETPIAHKIDLEAGNVGTASKETPHNSFPATRAQAYTHALRQSPPKSFRQQLQIYHGRLSNDKWWKVALRPFILFAYPAVLWSAAIYACSVGWLIVISESVAVIYREGSYHFSALSTGLVYISPFIGGILGTAVAGRVSDVLVKAMARRNGGLYEPEFRLVMAAPIAITTVIGIMGFGWSAHENDAWIVPTIFFGVISFGCCLGSTTSITFCVDSYRQYAGEALVTLNFSKNIFHGFVFSLFFTGWLTKDGSKTVFIWIGVMQLIVCFFSIPMYIYGKRARQWTVRRNLMERF